MAGTATGWSLRKKRRPDDPNEIRFVKFTINKKEHERTTGEADLARAEAVAAQIYADALAGRLRKRDAGPKITSVTKLEQVFSDYFYEVSENKLLKPETIKWRETCANTYLIPKFERLCDITAESLEAYALDRLKLVKRGTVTNELSCLKRALVSAKVKPLPAWPKIDPNEKGRRSSRRKQAPTVQLTEDEVKAVIAKLPERAKRASKKGEEPMLIKPFFEFFWETSLRPTTIGSISSPEHWNPFKPGDLHITEDIDKKEYGRDIPITPRAQAILRKVSGGRVGLIFGHADARSTRWRYWKQAAYDANMPRAALFKPYDVRHARITHLVSLTGDLRGPAELAGHKDLTTTAHYAKSNRAAAEATIAALAKSRGSSRGSRRASAKKIGKKAA